MAGIQLKNLNKTYDGGFQAVKNANLDIPDGELTVLVGPSGCGKSTTLRMIAGLEEVTSGEIFIGDRRVNDVAPGDRDIAMVFQNYALYPHMTVRQNLAFGLKMRRTPKTEIAKRVAEAAEILSIDPLLDRRPKALSGGQRQRVAVGRAIVRQPQVFLFDEPLSNLDAKLRVQMRTEIASLHNRLKTTMVYVTHDQVEAMTLGERIVIMHKGIIHQVDSPLNLYNKPVNRFVAGFIGSPAMNFIDGAVSHSVFEKNACRVDVPGAPDGPATLGVRSEDLLTEEHGPRFCDATLEVVEQMGHETMVYFGVDLFEDDGRQYVARLNANAPCRPGERLTLYLRPDSWKLFAPGDDGKRLF